MPSSARTAEKRCKVIEAANPLGLSAPLARHEQRIWLKVYREESWRSNGRCCAYCFEPLRRADVTADHVTARAHGGLTSAKNIKGACEPCNQAKRSWTESRFKRTIRNPSIADLSDLPFEGRMRVYRAHMRFVIWNRVKRFEKKLKKAVGL